MGTDSRIGYFPVSDADMKRVKAAEQAWFKTFRSAGSRFAVCEAIMRGYGPGAKLQLFRFK